jgi:hypothetical protein
VADVRRAQGGLGDPPDCDDAAVGREFAGEAEAFGDLAAGRPAIRAVGAGMRGDDVPEKNVVLDVELCEHSVDDGRASLCRAGARQLPFGRERDARDTRTAVAGRFADEQDWGVCPLVEVTREPGGQLGIAVLVERAADLCACDPAYQCSQRTTSSSERRRWVMRDDAPAAFGSGRSRPIVTPATTETSFGMPSSRLYSAISGTVTP